MFSNVKSQMTGWLGNASIPSMPGMPSMPAMPAMPSMSSIPGLRKGATAAAGEEGIANEGLDTTVDQTAVAATVPGTEADIEDDRSRYIRYGPCINDGKEMVFFLKSFLNNIFFLFLSSFFHIYIY